MKGWKCCLMAKNHILQSKYSGISIKRTPYKADISIRRTVTPCTDGYTVKLSLKNLYKADIYKADIYKADSYKTDTFFVHQMKFSPKTTLCKADTGCRKTIFMKEVYIYFS